MKNLALKVGARYVNLPGQQQREGVRVVEIVRINRRDRYLEAKLVSHSPNTPNGCPCVRCRRMRSKTKRGPQRIVRIAISTFLLKWKLDPTPKDSET
jgi:hypothetical protein